MSLLYRGENKQLKATFTDTSGTVFDPSVSVLNVYDPLGVLKQTYALTDLTRVDVGVYFINYPIPADAEFGRWYCNWSGTHGSFISKGGEAWFVAPVNAPTVEEVRNVLGGMDDDRVTDPAMIESIMDAVLKIDTEKSGNASEALVSRAYVNCAAYNAYLTYASEFERTAGLVPGPILNHLGLLEKKCTEWIGYVRRGIGQSAIGPIRSYTPTVVPETYEPDAEGEPE